MDPKTKFAVRHPTPELAGVYEEVLHGIARNVKMGPFKATSGLTLPYYLNSSTNFMDKTLAPKIIQLFEHEINESFAPTYRDKKVVCIGMEAAGGMLVSQLCASSALTGGLADWADFLYMRKGKKKTGTAQQLEGTKEFNCFAIFDLDEVDALIPKKK
eukprot:TRINITY_DN17913_c0_g1_i1.p1 TRINITY_DN17913_c0_g1~~TRINITY_DN17913_c0_g1_i1.p1  ORF type:complete len:177 (-),score=34.82 TRINITY_DN17913_c0_g1_i1:118-591(-)